MQASASVTLLGNTGLHNMRAIIGRCLFDIRFARRRQIRRQKKAPSMIIKLCKPGQKHAGTSIGKILPENRRRGLRQRHRRHVGDGQGRPGRPLEGGQGLPGILRRLSKNHVENSPDPVQDGLADRPGHRHRQLQPPETGNRQNRHPGGHHLRAGPQVQIHANGAVRR